MTNQTELAGKQEQAKKKRTAALAAIKQNMRKRQLAERQKRTKQVQKLWIEQNTTQSESENEEVEVERQADKPKNDKPKQASRRNKKKRKPQKKTKLHPIPTNENVVVKGAKINPFISGTT